MSGTFTILMVSPRAFGIMGTSGTYLLAEAYAKYADVHVLANARNKENVQIVHSPSQSISLHYVPFDDATLRNMKLAQLVKDIQPDIITVGSHVEWPDLVAFLKLEFPESTVVLDVKSPLLAAENSKRAKSIKQKAGSVVGDVDLVITRSLEDLPTWCDIPFKQVVEYPLGINCTHYSPRACDETRIECKRFVYVGSIHAMRKISTLLEYIALLPEHVRASCVFDFYGSGPYVDEFTQKVNELGLVDTVFYRGCLDVRMLSQALSDYDVGLAWVPRERYDSAPSLKLVEYLAAGLVPLATSTTAHAKYAGEGFAISYFDDENPDSFIAAVETLFSEGFDAQKRDNNLLKAQRFDWDVVARDHLIASYSDLLEHKRKGGMSEKKKLLLISRRPYGLIATPGTYYLANAYAEHYDVLVVAHAQSPDSDIVYSGENTVQVEEIDYSQKDAITNIVRIAQEFSPDITIIGNFPKWFKVLGALKSLLPEVRYVLDIKTPCFGMGEQAYEDLLNNGKAASQELDLVIGYDQAAIDSWIPWSKAHRVLYDLGVNLDQFQIVESSKSLSLPLRCVYVGSLSAVRQLDRLLTYLSLLPLHIRSKLVVDFYGRGPAEEELRSLATQLGLSDFVTFRGAYESEQLASVLSGYDVGIAWVPHAVFDSSPSLKLIEYMASGLVPLAMDTTAHKLYSERGFDIEYFSDSIASFSEAFEQLLGGRLEGINVVTNRRLLETFDWKYIASNSLVPIFNKLCAGEFDSNELAFKAIQQKVRFRVPDCSTTKCACIEHIEALENKCKEPEREAPERRTSDLLSKMQFWTSPVDPVDKAITHSMRGRSKVAGIFDNRLLDGLQHEVNLLPLTRQNWKFILQFAKPDVLIIESFWHAPVGNWNMSLHPAVAEFDTIKKLVAYAKKLSIPTVFWMTRDRDYTDNYLEAASLFDFVFCADNRCKEQMERAGIRAEHLGPCVQPGLYNPFRRFSEYDAIDNYLIYDGWAELDKFSTLRDMVAPLANCSLGIIESQYTIFKQRKGQLGCLADNILGCISKKSRRAMLRYAKGHIFSKETLATETEQAWMALEVAASRVPLFFFGEQQNNSTGMPEVGHYAAGAEDFQALVRDTLANTVAAERKAHVDWREVHAGHTVRKRLQTIFDTIGISFVGSAIWPKASVISPTIREDYVNRLLGLYESQVYPNKELILVLNGGGCFRKRYKGQNRRL